MAGGRLRTSAPPPTPPPHKFVTSPQSPICHQYKMAPVNTIQPRRLRPPASQAACFVFAFFLSLREALKQFMMFGSEGLRVAYLRKPTSATAQTNRTAQAQVATAQTQVATAQTNSHGTNTSRHGTNTNSHGTNASCHGTNTSRHGTNTSLHGTNANRHGGSNFAAGSDEKVPMMLQPCRLAGPVSHVLHALWSGAFFDGKFLFKLR